MALKAHDFFQYVEPALGELRTKDLHRHIYSDVIDSNGHHRSSSSSAAVP